MSNIINKIQVSGVTYDIGGSGGGGNPTVELTQAEYDALVTAGTVSADTYYIITDAEAGDLTNYYTKTETNTLLGGKADTATTYTKTETDNAITGATSTKQDTLVSGTNIKTINNTSLLGSGNIDIQGGGGGKAVSGGTNISITTGETADTINCTLPITADTKNNYIFITNTTTFTSNKSENVTFGTNNYLDCNASFVVGGSNNVYGNGCFVYGFSNEPRKLRNGLFGDNLKSTNSYEFGFGQYNNSVSASTTWGDSGNTLFSVGNGTSSARHNALEIRQNGDIYLSSGGTDIKLQDHLGGGGGGGTTYTAGDGIDITNNVISVTGKQDTLVSGTNIKTINNQSILGSGNIDIQGGGGGKAIEAGRGIAITTGETADTVSFNLPMSADTIGLAFFDSKGGGEISTGNSINKNNIVLDGYYNKIGGNGSKRIFSGNFISGWNSKIFDDTWAYDYGAMYNIIFGQYNTLSGNGKKLGSSIIVGDYCYGYDSNQSLFGYQLQAQNKLEHSIGQNNVSNKASDTFGDSGNTLFSVGNGTSNNARHNAFEIRQDGSIFLNDGTNDVKLQDTITATAANTTALGGLSLVKLSQSEYDSLATKDNSTLYVIVN